jgi:hypothetical protein
VEAGLTCTDCLRDLNRFNPACLQCGQRYLAAIKRQAIPQDEKVAWLRKVLADWMEIGGHKEADLRAKPVDPKGKK